MVLAFLQLCFAMFHPSSPTHQYADPGLFIVGTGARLSEDRNSSRLLLP